MFKFLLVALLFAATASASEAKLKVVASFSIIGDLVQQVGGEDIDLTTIVGPNADTHVYEPKPDDAQALARADAVFVNGLGFEGWQQRLVEASGYGKEIVTVSDGIVELVPEGESAADPHGWQSVVNAKIYVANIQRGLCRADVSSCDKFEARATTYLTELDALNDEINAMVTAIPVDQRVVISSHDAFGYFAKAHGIRFLAPEGVNTESEATARDVATLIRQIRAQKAKALFLETISDPRLIAQIADETGIVIGGALYSDALSEGDGPAPHYVAMMRHNARLIAEAMN
jgi:zinc/manganese transport system substrate-binding protein